MDALFFQSALDHLPMGVFVLNRNQKIDYWNHWLSKRTNISSAQAMDTPLHTLFNTVTNFHFEMALKQIWQNQIGQAIPRTSLPYLIPIEVNGSDGKETQYMQQQVHITPLKVRNDLYALITINDVTENVLHSYALREMASKYEEDSNRDQLTNVYNRRFLWEWLVQQFTLGHRHHFRLTCLLFDIDRFKLINDTYGHTLGDQVLKEFVEIVSLPLRESDLLARYGGEEFVALLPKCDLEQAQEVAERIRKTVANSNVAKLGQGKITCSIGIACWDPSQPCTSETLLKRADEQLYIAKNNGRNQIRPILTEKENNCSTT